MVVSLLVAFDTVVAEVIDAVEVDWTNISALARVVAFKASFSLVALVVELSAEPVNTMNSLSTPRPPDHSLILPLHQKKPIAKFNSIQSCFINSS